MIEISCCMIVKNEEKVLARCLDSVADLMDEIIIVDTGSTDGTKEIAARYTDKIYDFEWIDGGLRCAMGDADDCRAGQYGLVFEYPFSFLL